MIIIFLGPPEAGKGTQANLLAEKLGLPHFSIGQLLREEWAKGTKIGKEGETYWGEKGINVPTRISFPLLKKYLQEAKRGFILDNFPRTSENLKFLQDFLQKTGLKIDFVFHLYISQKEGEKRRKFRAKYSERIDETTALLSKRRGYGYVKDIATIKNYFTKLNVWYEIDGEKPRKAVYTEILKIITDYGTKN